MFPIFFSVAGEDTAFAEEVWEKFPTDWIYLWSRSGAEGAHVWDEISRDELPKARVFVVFWSQHYPKKDGCVKELKQASDLVRKGLLRPVVLRVDDTPITWKDEQPADLKPVFEALKQLLDHRTSDPGVAAGRAIEVVARAAEPFVQPTHPMWPRADLQQALRHAVPKDRFNVYPAVWISGFNGVGRETLVREFNRGFSPNGRGIVIDVNEASLPQQVLLRIESEAFGTSTERLEEIAKDPTAVDPGKVAERIQRVFDGGDYVILRHNRIVEENVELPEWLDDVFNELAPATRCKLFVISQLPLMAERRIRCRDKLVSQRVHTLDELQMREFCIQLIGHFDRDPERWTEPDITRVVSAAGGILGFLVSLVRAASNLDDLDQLDSLIAADNARMGEMMTVYLRWAYRQLGDDEDSQKTLLFLNDITPCHIDDLEKVIAPIRPMLRVLNRLMDLGLVERETDGVYRLTPLLVRRLGRELIKPDLVSWIDGAMRALAASPITVPRKGEEDGHEYLRLEARIQSSLLSGQQIPAECIRNFVSASHIFQAGIRLYHCRHYDYAYRLLKKIFSR